MQSPILPSFTDPLYKMGCLTHKLLKLTGMQSFSDLPQSFGHAKYQVVQLGKSSTQDLVKPGNV